MTDTQPEQTKQIEKPAKCRSFLLGFLTIVCLFLTCITVSHCQQLSESKKQMITECDSLIMKINHQEITVDSSKLCGSCKQLHLKQKEMQKAMSDYTRITYPIYKENARLHDQYSTFLTEYAIWTAIIVALITGITLIIGFLFKYDLQDSLKQIKEESKEQEAERRKELNELKSTLAAEKDFNCIRSLNTISPFLLSTPGMIHFLNSMLPGIIDSLVQLLDNRESPQKDKTLLLINIHEMLLLIDPLMAHDPSTDITHLIRARELIRCVINRLNRGETLTELDLNNIRRELSNINIALTVEYDTNTQR